METKTILSIAERTGLYYLVSQGSKTLIVEAIDEKKKRFPILSIDRITALNDISIYTSNDDEPLVNILEGIKEKENSAKTSFNPSKTSNKDLLSYIEKIVPNYDRDKVYPSDVKKIIKWYNILIGANITNFKEILAKEDKKELEDKKED